MMKPLATVQMMCFEQTYINTLNHVDLTVIIKKIAMNRTNVIKAYYLQFYLGLPFL